MILSTSSLQVLIIKMHTRKHTHTEPNKKAKDQRQKNIFCKECEKDFVSFTSHRHQVLTHPSVRSALNTPGRARNNTDMKKLNAHCPFSV